MNSAKRVYDAEGRAIKRSVKLTGGYPVIDDSLAYDPLGRISGGRTYAAPTRRYRDVWNFYAGLGALAGMEQAFSDGADPKREEFRSDAVANRTYSEQRNFIFSYEGNPTRRKSTYDAEGRLNETYTVTPSGAPDELGYWELTGHWYDARGHQRYRAYTLSPHDGSSPLTRHQEASYYQADGKLAVFERHEGDGEGEALGGPLTGRGLNEAYRYDALGRRVLVHARRGAACTATGCESTVRRAVWAGEQLVYETRGPGADSVNSAALETETPSGNGDRGQANAYGTVVYAHASGIDRPLSVRRTSTSTTFFPHGNWRGLYDGATNPAGAIVPCYGSNPAPCANAPDIDWPGSTTSAYIGATPTSRPAGQLPEWAGSLVTEQADASGLLYRRNRYYDPQSGRFTQPDPIGLAGGLNAYGYANGDPVNYSDPFGLTGCRVPEEPCPLGIRIIARVLGLAPADVEWGLKKPDLALIAIGIRGQAENFADELTLELRGDDDMNQAARHQYGMCRVASEFSPSTAQELGDAHEDAATPGEAADTKRDRVNNAIGILLGRQPRADCAQAVRDNIVAGRYPRITAQNSQ